MTGPGHQTIGEYILAAGSARADHPAVVCDSAVLTYGGLREQAGSLAEVMVRHGVEPGHRVLVQMEPCPMSVVVLIACSLAGAVYVPMSPQLPAARYADVVRACRPTARMLAAPAARLPGVPVDIWPTTTGFAVHRFPATDGMGDPAQPADPGLAYLIFTSGTTGRPKGIAMTHRAVVAYFHGQAQQAPCAPDERLACFSPLHFDLSLLNLGMAASAGATLVQVPHGLIRHPRRLVSHLARMEVTRGNGVPSMWQNVVRHAEKQLAALHHLRSVLLAGEAYPLDLVRALRRALPSLRVFNAYGQSESIACSLLELPHSLPAEGQRVPIGPAHPGAELLVLDDNRHPVPIGGVGEAYLRSPALFSGYWNDPETTARALVTLPGDTPRTPRVLRTGDLLRREADGTLTFCGRADLQVKIFGNRVELEEIEACLRSHPAVTDAVLVSMGNVQDTRLAALVTLTDPVVDAAALRSFCTQHLPSYMVPLHILPVAELPRTTSGKLDRAAARQRAGHAFPNAMAPPVPDHFS